MQPTPNTKLFGNYAAVKESLVILVFESTIGLPYGTGTAKRFSNIIFRSKVGKFSAKPTSEAVEFDWLFELGP